MEIQEIINLFLQANELGELSPEGINDFHHSEFIDFANKQGTELVWDSINSEFIESDNSVSYNYRGETLQTNVNEDLLFFNDELYEHSDSNLDYYDIVELYSGEYSFKNDAYYGIIDHRGNEDWFSSDEDVFEFDDVYYISYEIACENGIHHCERCEEYYNSNHGGCDECGGDDNDSYNFDYHSSYRADKTTHETKFAIGFEVEKEDRNAKESDFALELFNNTGWAKERDGSLDDESGFELVSPTFDLFDNTIIDSFNKVESYLNAKYSSACGGHINYSIKDLSPEEMLKSCEGYLPLLYSMYEKRLDISYCKAKKAELLYSDRDKYQSVALKDNRIEFRIFSAVKTKTHLEWRLDLMRIFANNPRTEVHLVLKDMCNKESDLYNHLSKIYSAEQIKEKTKLFIKYALELEEIGLQNLVNDAFEYNINEKPILPLPIRDFKVGDCVQIKTSVLSSQGNTGYINVIGIVSHVSGNRSAKIEFTHDTIDYKGYINYFNVKFKDLIFMEEFPNMSTELNTWSNYQIETLKLKSQEIKEGAHVRIVNHIQHEGCRLAIGVTGIVNRMDGNTAHVKVESEAYGYWVYMHQLEVVLTELQVGDIVRVLRVDHRTEHITIGHEVQISRIRGNSPYEFDLVTVNLDHSIFGNWNHEYFLSRDQVEFVSRPQRVEIIERSLEF